MKISKSSKLNVGPYLHSLGLPCHQITFPMTGLLESSFSIYLTALLESSLTNL